MLKFLLLIVILMPFALSCFAQSSKPVAVFNADGSGNISLYSGGDGCIFLSQVNGRIAARLMPNTVPQSVYMYFQIDPSVKDRIAPNAYIVIDAYSPSGLGNIGLEHNQSSGSTYGISSNGAVFFGESWTKSVIRFQDFEALGNMNAGSHFRITPGEGVAVSKIEIYNEYPQHLNIPDVKSQLLKYSEKNAVRPAPGMYYTFGSDVNENMASLFKSLGVTSVESYVTWKTVENKGRDQWDWSRWDDQIKVLKSADLKWVPFVIIGPAYSTPDWFVTSDEHVPCVCVEHNQASKIESLWNPNLLKYIERFMAEFARRYAGQNVIESVLLGIQGDFGEAIYSVSGNDVVYAFSGKYHNHMGYWCNDEYAKADFKKYISDKYAGKIQLLNQAWNTDYKSFEDVAFPFSNEVEIKAFMEKIQTDPTDRRHYLDYVAWYRDSMTDLADWWMEITRKYFPKTDIYLCTGGHSAPELGGHFADQLRVAAKHNAGVRITNESSDYAANFAVTRWVASAGKHYGAYFGFEPAGPEDFYGIPARIYNATASGANQLHDYNNNVVGSEKTIEQQKKHFKYLFHVKNPVVPIALWYPDTSLSLKWDNYLDIAGTLRDYFDYDMVDESLLRNGALKRNKILVIAHGAVMETSSAQEIAAWVKSGGRVIVVGVDKFTSVEGTDEPDNILFAGKSKSGAYGKGYIYRVADYNELSERLSLFLGKLGYPVYDITNNGVYATQIGKTRFLLYSKNDMDTDIKISYKGKEYTVNATAKSITDFSL